MGKREKIYRIIIALLLIGIILMQTPVSLQAAVKCKSVKMNVTKGTIGIGEVLTLNAITTPLNATGKQVWSSSNKKVATVTQYGAVTGVGIGSATITVKVNGKKATCRVTVTKYATVGTQVDMSEYVKKRDLETLGYVKKSDLETLGYVKTSDLECYESTKDFYTKKEIDTLLKEIKNNVETNPSSIQDGDEEIDKSMERLLIFSDDNFDIYVTKLEYSSSSNITEVYFAINNKTSITREIDFKVVNVNGKNAYSRSGNTIAFSGLECEHSKYFETKITEIKTVQAIIYSHDGNYNNLIEKEFKYPTY